LLHRCYLDVLGLSFSTHSRILFSSEYFHYKIFTSRGPVYVIDARARYRAAARPLGNTALSNTKYLPFLLLAEVFPFHLLVTASLSPNTLLSIFSHIIFLDPLTLMTSDDDQVRSVGFWFAGLKVA
jgi:hypothetical protein